MGKKSKKKEELSPEDLFQIQSQISANIGSLLDANSSLMTMSRDESQAWTVIGDNFKAMAELAYHIAYEQAQLAVAGAKLSSQILETEMKMSVTEITPEDFVETPDEYEDDEDED